MRRLSLSEYQVLSVLPEPIKEPLQDINIELFEGDNYIYLVDMIGNKFYAEYLIKNDFTDTYVIKSELNSAIESTAKSIELSVNQKLESYYTTEQLNAMLQLLSNSFTVELSKKVNGEDITGAYLMLLINGDKSEAKLKADKIKLSANDVLNLLAENTINLTSKKIAIVGDNLNITEQGNMTLKSTPEAEQPSIKIINPNQETTYVRLTSGRLEGHSNDKIRTIFNYNIGLLGLTSSDGEKATHVGNMSQYQNSSGEETIQIKGDIGNIKCISLTQTSLKSKKKNIKKLKVNALELVKNADVCEYNFKREKEGSKKHIGLVIGEGYNCPEEVISKDGQGVEQYSLTSLLYKAFQQYIKKTDKQIEELSAKVEKLEQEVKING